MILPTPSPMIATKTAVLMTAMIIGVVGISVTASPAAEAGPIVTSRSNLKPMVVQPEQEQSCINQVDGQGDKQATTNPDQTQAPDQGNAQATLNAEQSREGDFTQGDPEITVNADASNECSQELNITLEDNGDVSDSDITDSSTNEAA
jgi:hypothetical protein